MPIPSLAAAEAEAEAAYQAKPVPKDPSAQAATSLFFVALRDGELESYDLLVEALSLDEAIALWRGYFELDDAARPESVFTVPALTGASHAMFWHNEVREVGGAAREEG